LVPAVQKVREAAARTQSTNNLKQIALATHSFHDANKHLPFNGSDLGLGDWKYSKAAKAGTFTSGSWGFQILPYLDQKPMFDNLDRSAEVKAYMCPGRGRPPLETSNGGGAWSDYFWNNYINSQVNAEQPDTPSVRRTLIGITDGTSNTVLAGHGNINTTQYSSAANVTLSCNIFTGGTWGTARGGTGGQFNQFGGQIAQGGATLQRDAASAPGLGSWGGPFPQGGLMVMADARVFMFPYATKGFTAFLTPTGGEVVNLPND
jgi:hypothetical protein